MIGGKTETYTINYDNSIIIYNGNWKIKQIEPYRFKIYHYTNNKWKRINTFTLNEDTDIEKISNTPFDIRFVINYMDSEYFKLVTVLEITVHEDRELRLDVKIKRGDEDSSSDDDFKKKKKMIKIEKNKNIDILLFGVYHNDNEWYLSKFFLESMTQYIKEISSKKLCCLWETPPLENNNIQLNKINGETTLSFQVKLEPDIIGCFSFLDSAIIGFMFPLSYDNQNKVIVKNDQDIISQNVNNLIQEYHGKLDKNHDINRYGTNYPYAIELSWNFICLLFISLVKNNNNTDILSFLFKESLNDFINELRDLMKILLSLNQGIYNNTVNNIVKRYGINKDRFKIDDITIFNTHEHIIMIKEILTTFDFRECINDTKVFMFNTWSKIVTRCNSEYITLKDRPVTLNLNKKSEYSIDYDYSQTILNTDYFTLLFNNEINGRLTIDIPTLMFLLHFYYLTKDSINITKDSINKMTNTFVQLRDIFSCTNLINISNNSDIERFIVFCGTDHIKNLNELLNEKDITVYSHSYNITIINEDYYNKLKLKYKDFIEVIDMIKLDLNYYLYLEFIDYWLYETDIGKNNIDYEDIIEKEKLKNTKFKLNFYTKQRTHLKKLLNLTNNNSELEHVFMIISIYYGLLISYYTPVTEYKYTNSSNSYFNTESPIKEDMLNEYLYPYIVKDKINIKYFRIIGDPLIKFSYIDEDFENEETMEDDVKTFIELILEKIKEGFTINI